MGIHLAELFVALVTQVSALKRYCVLVLAMLFLCSSARANLPTGGDGSGPRVTITVGADGPKAHPRTIHMDNGIVHAVICVDSSQILQLSYHGHQVTNGRKEPNGAFYWQGQNSVAEQMGANGILTVIANPATNGGNFAAIRIANLYANQDSQAYKADAYYYFAMFRGSPGIYVAEVMSRSKDSPAGGADIPSFTCKVWDHFNWLGEDTGRNLLRESEFDDSHGATGVNRAPKEVYLLQTGILAGQFECKYDFCGDMGRLHFTGWCSTDLDFGLWMIHPSREYFSCGPNHNEIIGQFHVINTSFKGVHLGFASDLEFTNGESWSRVCGPLFLYFNQVPPGTPNPQESLYGDAAAQAAAEATAWPYRWFSDPNYAQSEDRGTTTGRIVIRDSGNPNASAAGLWVGVLQQPPSSLKPPGTDFQHFGKGYQFWVQTDTNGNFTIPNVIAGTNYTLVAYGPGAIGLYQSQSFGSPAPPVQLYVPPKPFAIAVTGGQTNELGEVIWAPERVGATVWELGVPDRDTTEFRHGADYWHGDLGNADSPANNWGQWQDYAEDFPGGVNYTNGQSRWSADWDYAQPTVTDPATGALTGTTNNIFFDLASAPVPGANASLYIGIAGDYQGPVIVTVNGVNITTPANGFFPRYECDPMIRMASHGIFCDQRLNFAGKLLHPGQNEIQLNMRKGGYFSDSILYDYIRLELTGYVPPAPAGLNAIAGNGRVVLDWPASSGATSYEVLRSAVSGSGYTIVATNVIGPVVGSDVPNATYTDSSVVNGTAYYYVVRAANPDGISARSIEASARPSDSTAPVPQTPTGLLVTPGYLQATLRWNPSPGAANYCIRRMVVTGGALANDPGAVVATAPDGSIPVITINSFVTGTNYTDRGLSKNVRYAYTVSAANANGQSADSEAAGVTIAPISVPYN